MDRVTTSTSSTTNSTSIPAASNNTSAVHPDRSKYLAALDNWTVTEANGIRVAEKIKQWLNDGKADAVLNLSELDLHSLPPLPGNLKRLKADKNHLINIPENYLPVSLEALDVHGNQLTSLPASLPIAHLKLLNVSGNNLGSLPSAAFMLDPTCKVFFVGNNLDSALLTGHFGPEQHQNGMRQISTAAEFLVRQAEAVATLTTALSH
jgi:Leucine-rich repeat (LRR) protein